MAEQLYKSLDGDEVTLVYPDGWEAPSALSCGKPGQEVWPHFGRAEDMDALPKPPT